MALRRIGLYGGAFNPPHVGHLVVAELMREAFALEAVWWIPTHEPPHKDNQSLAAPEHRLAMVEAAIAGHEGFAVSRVELDRSGPSFTYDTVMHLQRTHPDVAFQLILGGDSLRAFMRWHRPLDIVSRVPLLVYRRPGDDLERADLPQAVRTRIHLVEAPYLEVSSTDLRARVARQATIRYLVPEAVRHYIQAHHLYR
ncbi:MAG: nicotinate-nucleotide adenylyltransferase [Bacteroidota bacterium]